MTITSGVPARSRVIAAGRHAPIQPPSWTDHALCGQADPEAWFPEPGIRTIAKTICARCPVRRPCLLFALATNQAYGIWGGLSTAERDRLRQGRAA